MRNSDICIQGLSAPEKGCGRLALVPDARDPCRPDGFTSGKHFPVIADVSVPMMLVNHDKESLAAPLTGRWSLVSLRSPGTLTEVSRHWKNWRRIGFEPLCHRDLFPRTQQKASGETLPDMCCHCSRATDLPPWTTSILWFRPPPRLPLRYHYEYLEDAEDRIYM